MPKYDGKFYEDGDKIRCSKCNISVTVIYYEFPCKDDFIIFKLRCDWGCGARWRRKINPTPPAQLSN